MTTDEADSKNKEIERNAQEDIKRLVLELLEVDADQVKWGRVAALADAAAEFTDDEDEDD